MICVYQATCRVDTNRPFNYAPFSVITNQNVVNKNNTASSPTQNDSFYKPSLVLKLTIGLIGMFAFLQVYSIQAILPVLMADFSATEVQAGMVVGATILAIAIMSPFLGMLSDAVGRKVFIVGALLFLAIPTALIAQSPSIGWMGVWRFLQGLSVPGITVVTIAYIGEEFEGRAVTELMSFYVSGSVLGGFMGRFLLGHLHELIGWRAGYYVMAAMTLLGALWVTKMLPVSRQFVANPNFRSAIQTLGEHLVNRYVVTACLLGACVLFSLVGCFTFINLHLADTPYELSYWGACQYFCRVFTGGDHHAAFYHIAAPLWLSAYGTRGRGGLYAWRTADIGRAALGRGDWAGGDVVWSVYYPVGDHQLYRSQCQKRPIFGVGSILYGLLCRRHAGCMAGRYHLCARTVVADGVAAIIRTSISAADCKFWHDKNQVKSCLAYTAMIAC